MPHSYENYDEKSKTYTSLRRAIGLDSMINHYKENKKPIAEQLFLDAGCGTGNYTVPFYELGFKGIQASDYNGGMITAAKKNLTEHKIDFCAPGDGDSTNCRVCVSQEDVLALSYKDEGFDGVCCNQVVHHLRPDNDFDDLKQAAREFYRVLSRDGGRLTINWSTPMHSRNGKWYAELVPVA